MLAEPATDGLTYGLTPGETRYSPLNQINAANVSRLGLAWSYDIGVGGGNQEATPLVFNGTLHGFTNWSIVFAVDARTGREKGRWDPEVNRTARVSEDLLRSGESRSGDLSGHDHRAGHRWKAGGARR
jgi:glucose dehydrogenase